MNKGLISLAIMGFSMGGLASCANNLNTPEGKPALGASLAGENTASVPLCYNSNDPKCTGKEGMEIHRGWPAK